MLESYRKAFEGWDGVSVYCRVSPEDAGNNSLCDWALKRIRIVAISTNVLAVVGPSDAFDRTTQLIENYRGKHLLDLEIRIFSSGSRDKALYVKLSASSFYSNAIEDRPFKSGDMKPEDRPKAGELVYWQSDFLASGYTDNNPGQVQQALDGAINSFFADFVEARRPDEASQPK